MATAGVVWDVGATGAEAVVAFAATNVDDLLVLALLFGLAGDDVRRVRRVWIGQYLGFAAIVAVALLGAATLRGLPEERLALLGLVPIGFGVAFAVQAWRGRGEPSAALGARAPGIATVAGITIANGGDNLGVYVPVFATSAGVAAATHVAVYLALVAVWCRVGHWLASRPPVARTIERWAHVVVPVVFVAIGVAILVEAGAVGR